MALITERNAAASLSAQPGVTNSPAAVADLTMYTTSWCGYCVRLKGQLRRAGIGFHEVNIETAPEAAEVVEQVNDGNQTVPTLVFADGSALTNPSVAQVSRRLAELAA
jgi:mycoredoxin